jgi:hypothetical protein
MQKFSPFSSSQFFCWCKSDEHRDFHQGAGFNPASLACTPGVPTQALCTSFLNQNPSLGGIPA